MKRVAIALLVAGCGFEITVGGDIPDGTEVTLRDDTAADFAQNVTLTGGVVADRGAIEPDAYVVGGLYARGYLGNLVTDTSTWDTVNAAVGVEVGASYRQVPADWSGTAENRPRGVGITVTGNYTLLYTGEILLPKGMVALEATVDDRAVVQVALDGINYGERLFSKMGAKSITLDVPADGWYPIRAVFGQAGGGAGFTLAITPMGGAKQAVDGSRLRVRVTDGGGLIVSRFDGQGLLVPKGETAAATIDASYGINLPPGDTGLVSVDRFSQRFAGQVRIDDAGMYTFSASAGADTNDLWRIWIDGVLRANYWGPTPDQTMVTVMLEPGWHDLLVDHGEFDGNAQITVRMSGPGITAGPIEPGRLRPAVRYGTAPFFAAMNYTLNDATPTAPGITVVTTPLTAAPGTTIVALDHGFGIANQRMTDLTVVRIDCHGTTAQNLATMPAYHYFAADATCAGSAISATTTWGFHVTDNVQGNDLIYVGSGILWNPMLVATTTGGDRPPLSPAITFVSTPRPTPGSLGFGRVKLTTDLGDASLTFEVRSADDEQSLETADWVAVADGEVPAAPAGEWVQYRISIGSDGWQQASVDAVEITYVVPGP